MDIEFSPVSALRMTIAEVFGGFGCGVVGKGYMGLHVKRRVGPGTGMKVINICVRGY